MKSPRKIAFLLRRMPYLTRKGLLPPLRVVNDMLSKGVCAGGPNGQIEWKPMTLDNEEYLAVIQELRGMGLKLEEVDIPLEVNTYSLWSHWRIARNAGAYGAELMDLFRQSDALHEAWRLAEERGEDHEVARLQLLGMELDSRTSEILRNLQNRG